MEYNLILNFKRSEILQTDIVFSQGDYGKAMLRLSCRDDDVPITGAQSATISFSTPNGYLVTGELVGGDGEYSYTFKGNELQAPGRITATVSLKWADGRLSSCMFSFKCRAVQGGTAIDSGNYLTEVDQVVQEAKAKIAELQKLIDQLKPGIGSTALTKADLQNDLTQEQSGIKALDALQGKVLEKMLNDLSDKMSNELKTYVSKKQIINNLLSTVPGNVLDAMQGKALGDRLSKTEQSITQLNSENIPYVGNISNYSTMEALFSAAQNGILKIGVCQWNSDLRPDNTNGVVFIGNWEVMAICLSGKIYRIYNNQWIEAK